MEVDANTTTDIISNLPDYLLSYDSVAEVPQKAMLDYLSMNKNLLDER